MQQDDMTDRRTDGPRHRLITACWLGGRKGIRPVNKPSGGVLVWLSVWSKVQSCIRPSRCHCRSLSLAAVPAHPGSPGKRAVKRVCVCYYFASATVVVYSSHMTALSSASWSRFGPPSNFVTGHVSTMWYIFTVKRRKTRSRWKASQEFL